MIRPREGSFRPCFASIAGEHASRSGSAGEFVHEDNRAVPQNVVLVLLEHDAGFQAGANLREEPGVLGGVDVAGEHGFRLVRSGVGEVDVAAVVVDAVIVVGEIRGLFVDLGGASVVLGGDVACDDQRNTRFVYHNAVGFVDYREVQLLREHHLGRFKAYEVPQVVEAGFLRGEVHDLL